jgi:hypothetical protein
MQISIPFQLGDEELFAELARLAKEERGAVAKLIAHLVALDARGAHLARGYPSLFVYCREALHLSEHEAYNRIEVARAARVFPELLGLIHEGALTPTSARVLAPSLTKENSERLLSAAAYRSKRDVEELIAQERPRPDVAALVRKLPEARHDAGAVPAPALCAAPTPNEARRAPRPSVVAPLSCARYEVRFTASAATREKLDLAQDLLRHSVPDGDIAEIIDRALTLLVEDATRKKFAVVRRPRNSAATSSDARVPGAEVKRRVYLRDAGRCAFVGGNGRRCNSRALLEFHHLRPYADGGEATVENIQLRCRAHNRHEAQAYFGPIWAVRN